ncbi:MAG TPA: HEAT repeat domain-containing protein, partial [Pyrinomonadaceae bacterium]|nr:HEAT repeat domain-containing protein [Pyrinomonadaceae bacterium]
MRIKRRHPTILLPFAVACMISAVNIAAFAQPKESQTPLQRQIEVQRNRLTSADAEERRDALMKLNLMRRPEASRAAVASLTDAEPSVRVAAAHALASAPAGDAANALIPLLQDKLEFVRREVAYALGDTRSHDAVSPLTNLLATDKEMSVRAAAAVALGRIKDESAVMALAKAIDERAPKKKAEEYEFVKRAAVESLGEIRSPAGVQT